MFHKNYEFRKQCFVFSFLLTAKELSFKIVKNSYPSDEFLHIIDNVTVEDVFC